MSPVMRSGITTLPFSFWKNVALARFRNWLMLVFLAHRSRKFGRNLIVCGTVQTQAAAHLQSHSRSPEVHGIGRYAAIGDVISLTRSSNSVLHPARH